MKKIINYKSIEYLSLILVVSFIPLHNIYLVFMGILLAVYIVTKKQVNDTIKILYNAINNFKLQKNNSPLKKDSEKLDLIDYSLKISLVEEVEESGIIPSLSKCDDEIAA